MNWIKTINDAIKYMEGHLKDEITLADIAKHVNLSAFHFQRAFSLLTEMSPAEYLRKRRLSTPRRFSGASDRCPGRSRTCGNGSTRNGCRFPIMS